MENESVLENIKAMITSKCGIDSDKISLHSKLENDLGMTGDDAAEFILEFSERFNVDISNFVMAEYFSSEGLSFFTPLVNIFKKRKSIPKKELTVEDLLKTVERKKF